MHLTIKEILKLAEANKSSDIHLVPNYPPMHRIAGTLTVLEEADILPKEDIQDLINELIDRDQRLYLQKSGELEFAYAEEAFSNIRIHIYKQRGSYAVAMRILPHRIPAPEEISLPPAVTALIQKKQGLVLCAGAMGSGKTTTMTSLIQKLSQTYVKNIVTIENPIEYIFPAAKSMISQREISYDTKSYATALRAVLHQDPDVVVVGELLDMETLQLVLNAAEAGRLIFATLHANSAAEAIEHILCMALPEQKEQICLRLARVLEAVIAQQLVTAEPAAVTDQPQAQQIAAFEVMLGNAEVREAIRLGRIAQLNAIIQANRSSGMQTMEEAIFGLYMKSRLTAAAAVDYAIDQDSMRQKVMI